MEIINYKYNFNELVIKNWDKIYILKILYRKETRLILRDIINAIKSPVENEVLSKGRNIAAVHSAVRAPQM